MDDKRTTNRAKEEREELIFAYYFCLAMAMAMCQVHYYTFSPTKGVWRNYPIEDKSCRRLDQWIFSFWLQCPEKVETSAASKLRYFIFINLRISYIHKKKKLRIFEIFTRQTILTYDLHFKKSFFGRSRGYCISIWDRIRSPSEMEPFHASMRNKF